MSDQTFTMRAVGHVESCFPEKTGTPRQPTLVKDSRARLCIDNAVFSNPCDTVEGLDGFSHVQLIFVFHENSMHSKFHQRSSLQPKQGKETTREENLSKERSTTSEFTCTNGDATPPTPLFQRTKVRPPRMDGQKLGMFACRSPYRFNNVGITVARLEHIGRAQNGSVVLHLRGIDLVDGTPILDIKPYIPEYDAVNGAETAHWFQHMPIEHAPLTVHWTDEAVENLKGIESFRFYDNYQEVKPVLENVLSLDPRSKYQREKFSTAKFGFAFDVVNVICTVDDEKQEATVIKVEDWSHGRPSKETLRLRAQEEKNRYRQSKAQQQAEI